MKLVIVKGILKNFKTTFKAVFLNFDEIKSHKSVSFPIMLLLGQVYVHNKEIQIQIWVLSFQILSFLSGWLYSFCFHFQY